MIIAIDFDGTIVEHDYPNIGDPVPNAIETMRRILDAGHNIILWTMRSGDKLQEAVDYLNNNQIELWGVNLNPGQYRWSSSTKQYAHLYIDDAAVGCPLVRITDENGDDIERPHVDWFKVESILEANKVI